MDQLKLDYQNLQNQVENLNQRVSLAENPHVHFESLKLHPNCIASYSLRQNADYLGIRGNRGLKYPGGINPGVSYDAGIDGAKVVVPPLSNELSPEGNGGKLSGQFMCWWNRPSWNIGDRVVVQYETMISQSMHDNITKPGLNGRFTDGYKFVNLCRGSKAVTYELQTFFKLDPIDTVVSVRGYDAGLRASAIEGMVGRETLSTPIPGGFDVHPGPDSYKPWNQNPPHPQQFRVRSNRWIRVTCEMERVSQGTRFKMWLADNDTDPKLIVASPTDPSIGFLTSVVDPIEAWFCQLDTSQETTYATPQPERWCGFRNLIILINTDGLSVLGGKTR